ncbi:MAG: pilus assembly protein PilM [Planctomycetes bacterium]|nr:pilus assembly protein PilM [Planctomycetota bacterium]
MAKYVGIDFGSRSIKILAVEGTPKRYTLTHFAERELPLRTAREGDDELVVQAIDSMFTEMKLPRDRVAVSLPAQDCLFREFFVPFTSTEQIAKIIKFETENFIPSTPIEDMIVDFHPIAVEAERTKLLVVACPKKNVARLLEILRRCDIDPLHVGLDVAGLYTTCVSLGLIGPATNAVLVDLGSQAMKIALVEEGKLVHIRTPRVGTEVLTRKEEGSEELGLLDSKLDMADIDVGQLDLKELEKELIVSLSSFEERGEAPSRPEPKGAEGDAKDAERQEALLSRAHREILRTLAGHRLKSPPEKILLAGGGSILPNLAEALAGKLQVEVVPLDVLSQVRHSLNGTDPAEFNHSLPVGLGLGLKLLGQPTIDFDLRKEEFRFTRKFEQVRGALAVAISGAFCLVLALCYLVQDMTKEYRKIHDAYLKEAMASAGFGKEEWQEHAAPAREDRRLDAILALALSRLDSGTAAPSDVSALRILKEFYVVAGEVTKGRNDPGNPGPLKNFFIDHLELRENQLDVQGTIDHSDYLQRLMKALKGSPSGYFTKYDYGEFKEGADIPFSVTIEVDRTPGVDEDEDN